MSALCSCEQHGTEAPQKARLWHQQTGASISGYIYTVETSAQGAQQLFLLLLRCSPMSFLPPLAQKGAVS